MNSKTLGIVLFILFIIGTVLMNNGYLDNMKQPDKPVSLSQIELSIAYGGEKEAFLKNPKVISILHDKYKISLNLHKMGSIEMVSEPSSKQCLFPSTQTAVEIAKHNFPSIKYDNTFSSPIVFYMWDEVYDKFLTEGIISKNGDISSINMDKMVGVFESGKKWKDFGLNIYGKVKIISTDPTKSNSGNIFASLLANSYSSNDVVSKEDISQILPKIKTYFASLGMMESSSGNLFESFIIQGVGARPIIVGYENQIYEFLVSNPNYKDLISKKIKVVYPEPTVFVQHPLIQLKGECSRLVVAFDDEEIKKIAQIEHGFRTGFSFETEFVKSVGISSNVNAITPLPSYDVVLQIIESLK